MTLATRIVYEKEHIPQVKIEFMNHTHEEEAALVKQLGEVLISGQQRLEMMDTTVINNLLNKWLEHTQAHFDRENRLMSQINFPAYTMHSSEHQAALAQMEAVLSTWSNNQDLALLEEYVFVIWPTWFENHVNTMDMVTAQYAVMNGFDPNAAHP